MINIFGHLNSMYDAMPYLIRVFTRYDQKKQAFQGCSSQIQSTDMVYFNPETVEMNQQDYMWKTPIACQASRFSLTSASLIHNGIMKSAFSVNA